MFCRRTFYQFHWWGLYTVPFFFYFIFVENYFIPTCCLHDWWSALFMSCTYLRKTSIYNWVRWCDLQVDDAATDDDITVVSRLQAGESPAEMSHVSVITVGENTTPQRRIQDNSFWTSGKLSQYVSRPRYSQRVGSLAGRMNIRHTNESFILKKIYTPKMKVQE